MADALDLPAEVISLCDGKGGIRPLRFRYTQGEERHTVRIAAIPDRKEIRYVGVEALVYLCLEENKKEGRTHLYELRYLIREHRWSLFRVIY